MSSSGADHRAGGAGRGAPYLHHLCDKANPSVWIHGQPFSFHQRVFDEIRACTPAEARAKLNHVDEVYLGHPHRVVHTKDAVVDFTGLKPGAVLALQHALVNADSWACFAADLNDPCRAPSPPRS